MMREDLRCVTYWSCTCRCWPTRLRWYGRSYEDLRLVTGERRLLSLAGRTGRACDLRLAYTPIRVGETVTVYPRIMCDRTSGSGPCPNDAVPGDSRCGHHGGREDSRRARSRVALAKRHVEGYVVTNLGDPRWIDPGYALLEEVAQSAGHVAFFRKKCEELEESQLVWLKVLEAEETKSGGGESGDYELRRTEARAEINRWWELYERERRHLATVSAAALKAGVEERRLRLAERAAAALDDMLGHLLEDLGHDRNSPIVREIVANRLGQLLSSDWIGVDRADSAAQSTDEDAALPLKLESGPDPVQF